MTPRPHDSGVIVLETERLVLRHLRPEDADVLTALYADPAVNRFLGEPTTRDEVLAGILTFIGEYQTLGYGLYATVLKSDGRVVGRCGLLSQMIEGRYEVEVAYALARPHWGRGLATEAARALAQYAFERLGCSRIVSIIHPENVAARGVAEKTGMAHERDIEYAGVRHCLFSRSRAGGAV